MFYLKDRNVNVLCITFFPSVPGFALVLCGKLTFFVIMCLYCKLVLVLLWSHFDGVSLSPADGNVS